MKHRQKMLPNWSLGPFRLLLFLALVLVTQQMLTNTPASIFASIWDKLLHFFAWGLIFFLAYGASQSRRSFMLLSLAILIYSLILEMLQPLVSQRIFSMGDILSNVTGGVFAYFLISTADNFLKKWCVKS
ncbi:MAG: VanZ family protein [Cellvibrionaceae bacterium]|jgi:VanZ family protein